MTRQEIEIHREKRQKYVWTTKEGVTIPFEKLKDDHLNNIINYLIRRGFLLTTNDSILEKLNYEWDFRERTRYNFSKFKLL